MMPKHLLVINFCMDPNDPSLSHQFEVVLHLATRFEKVSVITTRQGRVSIPENVSIKVINWKSGQKVENVIHLLHAFLQVCRANKPSSIFSHMVPIHAAVISPFSKIMKIPHVLWYAHAAKPKSLIIARVLVSAIASSTSGSCPLKGEKIKLIGQGVDRDVFVRHRFLHEHSSKFVYAGRMNESKNVPSIIRELVEARLTNPEITLQLIGNESGAFINEKNSDWVSAMPAISRSKLSQELENYDVFIHAFIGSLDKVLVEVTLKGLPIVTINGEYRKEFLSWDQNEPPILQLELDAFLGTNSLSISHQTNLNYEVALQKHELNGWIDRLFKLLVSAK